MPSQLKKFMVEELVSEYQDTDTSIVLSFQGVKANDNHQIRKSLREKHIKLNVVKNSSATLAFKKVGMEDIGKLLDGPNAIATGGDDPVSLAKGLKEWSKKVPALKIRGGYVDGRLITQQEVERLAALPSKEVLQAQILMAISAPMVGMVSAFSAPLRSLLIVLQAVRDQKQEKDT